MAQDTQAHAPTGYDFLKMPDYPLPNRADLYIAYLNEMIPLGADAMTSFKEAYVLSQDSQLPENHYVLVPHLAVVLLARHPEYSAQMNLTDLGVQRRIIEQHVAPSDGTRRRPEAAQITSGGLHNVMQVAFELANSSRGENDPIRPIRDAHLLAALIRDDFQVGGSSVLASVRVDEITFYRQLQNDLGKIAQETYKPPHH